MICPLKFTVLADSEVLTSSQGTEAYCQCETSGCEWWDEKKAQCCIKTLSQLKVQGSVDIHPY